MHTVRRGVPQANLLQANSPARSTVCMRNRPWQQLQRPRALPPEGHPPACRARARGRCGGAAPCPGCSRLSARACRCTCSSRRRAACHPPPAPRPHSSTCGEQGWGRGERSYGGGGGGGGEWWGGAAGSAARPAAGAQPAAAFAAPAGRPHARKSRAARRHGSGLLLRAPGLGDRCWVCGRGLGAAGSTTRSASLRPGLIRLPQGRGSVEKDACSDKDCVEGHCGAPICASARRALGAAAAGRARMRASLCRRPQAARCDAGLSDTAC